MKKRLDIKRLILLNLPYVFAFYFVDKLASVFRLAPGTELVDKLTGGFANVGTAFANPLPSFNPIDLLIGVSAGALLKLAVFIKSKNRKKFRQGEEYGSARWRASGEPGAFLFCTRRAHLLTTPKGRWYLPLASRALSEGDCGFCGSLQTMPQHLRVLLSSSARLGKYRRFN